jgi:hypothetical protein
VSGLWVGRQLCGVIDISPGAFTGQYASPRGVVEYGAELGQLGYGIPASFAPWLIAACTGYDVGYDFVTESGDYYENWPVNP